ncbi:uncharacterized protein LOC128219027 isoform X2 [Mya arenaria]|uniref:uncharacterized protein LOC128219027 isoform X2 n=1 Tax=Mya arenaria TaxID=6604 RepID=UPI0022DFDDDD|nr:uncharacterized protein LOC128219027 isoform X2 [Mya arenaria]
MGILKSYIYWICSISDYCSWKSACQEVFISQHETKWNQSTCTLAQPNVTCRGDGSCIVENGLEFLTNAEYQDNGLWIGYAKTWISYAYVGCEKSNTGAQYSVSTLGECRRTTGCHTFGIRKSTTGLRCKCTSNDNKRKQTCGRKCEEADQYPCGGTADTDIFSYYTVENVPPSNNSQDIHQNCLLFYYKHKPGYDYYWKPCTSTAYPKILCSNKYFSDKKAKAELDDQSEGNWAQAVEICADKGKFPASIRSINNGKFTDKDKQEHWTGIIKKESIVSLRDMHDISTYPPLTYAYVEKINQTFYVRFANEVDTKKSLCAGDGPSAGPTMTTRATQSSFSESTTTLAKSTIGPTSHVTSSHNVITTDIHSTQAPTLDTSTTPTSHTVPEGTTASLDKERGGSTAGLAAGLSVSLVVLIIVPVIVLVVLKRRGLLTKCYTTKDEKDNRNEDTRTEISFVSTPIFEFTTNTMNDLTASNHSYFVLESQFNRETEHYAELDTTDVDHYDSTEMSQKDTSDDYDTTDAKKGPAKFELAKSNNNYNKVTLHQSNEYDHIHQHGRLPKSDRQTENQYDISNNLIDGKPNDNFGDDKDTYNHLRKHESKSSGTDNVYGKSETDGNSGYETSSALKPRMNIDANNQQADYAVVKKQW